MTDDEVRAFARDLVALAKRHGADRGFAVLGEELHGPRFIWKDGKLTMQFPTREETIEP